MSLHCIWVWEIDHTTDKHTDIMFGIPILVWLGIAPPGRDKMPNHKRKYFITRDIKHVCTDDLTKPIKYVYIEKKDFFFLPKKGSKVRDVG